MDVILLIKIIAFISLLAVALIAGAVPMYNSFYSLRVFRYWNRIRESPVTMSHVAAFSGGLFLSMAFNHMLPESVEILEEKSSFPIAYTLLLSGYTLILFIEKLIVDSFLKTHSTTNDVPSERERVRALSIALSSNDLEEKMDSAMVASLVNNEYPPVDSDGLINYEKDEEDQEEHCHEAEAAALVTQSPTTAFVLMIALSVHSLFEGIALGVQTSKADLIVLFTGIIVHKWAEAVAIACSFVKSGRKTSTAMLFMLVFSMSSPLGVLIGIIVTATANETVDAVLTALAGGTFTYVGCHEIIGEEFSTMKHRKTKFICMLFGMIMIALLNLYSH